VEFKAYYAKREYGKPFRMPLLRCVNTWEASAQRRPPARGDDLEGRAGVSAEVRMAAIALGRTPPMPRCGACV